MVRQAHEPTDKTRAQVEALAAYGIKHDAIAAIVGVSDETLRKYYRPELDLGLAKVTAQVANSLVKKAVSDRSDSVAAAKFFLQSQAGWRERSEQTVRNNLADFSDAELADFIAKHSGSGGGGSAPGASETDVGEQTP